jgi:hypothetical protein
VENRASEVLEIPVSERAEAGPGKEEAVIGKSAESVTFTPGFRSFLSGIFLAKKWGRD